MKSNIYFPDDDTMIVRGQRVKVAEHRVDKEGNRTGGLDAAYGYKKLVTTPWGEKEWCTITPVPSLAGGLEFCAQVYRPKSNPHVRFCTFWIDLD